MSMDLLITIRALNQASDAIAKVSNQIEKLQASAGKTRKMGEGLQSFGKGATMQASLPIAGALGFATKAAIDFEKEMVNLDKLSDLGGRGSKEFEAMSQSILKLSREVPVTATGLAKIAQQGSSLGIAQKDLMEFAKATAVMSVAFEMSADNAGKAIGDLRNVYSLDTRGGVKEVLKLGNTINALGDSMATNEPDIVNAMTRVGGAARNFGFTTDQTAALTAAVMSMGNAPEIAATAINNWLPTLQTASKQTPKFQKALQAIGIDAKQLETDIGRNAPQAFQNLLKALGKVDAKTRAGVLQDMFGAGADARILSTLANDSTQLAKAFATIQKVDPNGLMRTFEANSATTASNLVKFQSGLFEAGVAIGAVILPALNELIAAVMPAIYKFSDFAKAHPGLIKIGVAIAGIVAAVGPLAFAIGSVVNAFAALKSGIAALKSLQLALAFLASGGAGAKIAAMFAGMAKAGTAIAGIAKGFAAVVGGAAALGGILLGVVYGVFALGSALSGVSLSFGDFINTIKFSLMELPANLAQLPGAIMAIFSAVGTQLRAFFVNIVLSARMAFAQLLPAIAQAFIPLQTMLTTLVTGFQMAFATLAAMVSSAIAQIQGVLSGLIGVITGIVSQIQATVSGAISSTIAQIQAGLAALPGVISSIGSQMIATITGLAGQFFAAGQALITQLANGIKAAAGAALSAMSGIAGQLRGMMPFSPAKYGPLSDIDKTGYGLVNTFAKGIIAAPLVKAMNSALMPMTGAMTQPLSMPRVGMGGAAPAPTAGGGGGINLTYAPTINAGGVGQQTDFRQMLQEHSRELVQLLQNEQRRLERTQYVPGGSLI